MSCNGCTKRFGLLTKEHGCPVCKYSFCTKCLRFSIKQDGKSKNVCLRCYNLFKDGKTANKNFEEKKMDMSIIDNPVENSAEDSVLRPTQKSSSAINRMTDTDNEIRQRLTALKQENFDGDTSAESSSHDIEKRLAALKGIEYRDYSEASKQFLTQRDNRTQVEQIEDLMKQFTEEQEIHDAVSDYRLAGIEEIEKRLVLLKGNSDNSKNQTAHSAEVQEDDYDEENEEDAVRKLTKRYLEEAAIDAKSGLKHDSDADELNNLDIPEPVDPSELAELPWCTICNEDATVRCVSCDGELFCDGCFKECHDDEEYKLHKTKPYKAIPKVEI